MLGKTSRSRNWNYQSSKPHIHRVIDRRAHGIAAGCGGVCEGGRHVRTEISTLGISNGCRPIRAYRGFDGGASRAVFHGKVKAANEKKTDAQSHGSDKQRDKHRRDDRELDGRGSLLITA
jgi:hypothetical protein